MPLNNSLLRYIPNDSVERNDSFAAIPSDSLLQTRTQTYEPSIPTNGDPGLLGGISRGLQRGYYQTAAGAQLLGGVSEEDRSDIARYTSRLQSESLAPSESYRRFTSARSFGEAWDSFWDDPIQITAELIAESLPASALSIGGGIAGAIGGPVGMGIGAGLGSALTEYASQYLDTIAESGVDLTDPEAIARAFDDDALLDRARNQGIAKGIPVGIFDGATMGLAGRLVQPAKAAFAAAPGLRTGARLLGAGLTETAGQALGGGLGEATGELAAGQRLQPGAIMAEAVGEIGPGVIETGIGTARRGFGNASQSRVGPIDETTNLTRRVEDTYGTMGEPGAYSSVTSGVANAQGTRTPIETTGREEGVVAETPGRLRLRDDAQGGLEAEAGTPEIVLETQSGESENDREIRRAQERGISIEDSRRLMERTYATPYSPVKIQDSLSDILPEGDRSLWHETSVSSAIKILNKIGRAFRDGLTIYTSNQPYLALGQKAGGVVIEFDSDYVNGSLNTTKTYTDDAKEYVIRKSLPQAIKSLTFKNARSMSLFRKNEVAARSFDWDNAEETSDGIRVNRIGTTQKRLTNEQANEGFPEVVREEVVGPTYDAGRTDDEGRGAQGINAPDARERDVGAIGATKEAPATGVGGITQEPPPASPPREPIDPDKLNSPFVPSGRQEANTSKAGLRYWSATFNWGNYDKIAAAISEIARVGRNVAQGVIGAKDDPIKGTGLTRADQGTKNVAETIHHNPIVNTNNFIRTVDEKVLKPLVSEVGAEKQESFSEYLWALSVQERYRMGEPDALEANFSPEQIEAYIRKNDTDVNRRYADTYFQLWNETLQNIANETPSIRQFLANKSNNFTARYIPNFHAELTAGLSPDLVEAFNTNPALKALTGGGLKVKTQHPAETITSVIRAIETISRNNRVLDQTFEIRDAIGPVIQQALQQIGAGDYPTVAAKVDALVPIVKRAIGKIDERSITTEDIQETIRWFLEDEHVGSDITRVPYYLGESGEKQPRQLPQYLYEQYKFYNRQNVPEWVRNTFGALTRMRKMFTTSLSTIWGARNIVIDALVGRIQTATDASDREYFRQYFSTVKNVFKRDSDMGTWFSEKTGRLPTFVLSGNEEHALSLLDLHPVEDEGPGAAVRSIGRGIKKGVNKIEYTLAATELFTRVTECLNVLHQNLKTGKYAEQLPDVPAGSGVVGNFVIAPDGTKVMRIAELLPRLTSDQRNEIQLAGMRISTNFSDMGYRTQVANQFRAYTASQIGGIRQAVRVYRRNPAVAAMIASRWVLAPTIAAWFFKKDEDWYRNAEPITKYLNMSIPVPGTESIIRFPKPFEWGAAFGTLPESWIDAAYRKDPGEITDGIRSFLNSVLPFDVGGKDAVDVMAGILGQSLGPLGEAAIEQYGNRDLFTGSQIVPEGEKELPAREQVGPFTSAMAKATSGTADIIPGAPEFLKSPRRVDNLIRTFFGRVPYEYGDALALINDTFFKGQSPEMANVPGIGGFVQRGGTGGVRAEATEEFYDDLRTLNSLESSREKELTPDQKVYLRTVRAASDELKLLRDRMVDLADPAEKSRLGNEMREVAQRTIAERPASMTPREATDAEKLLNEARSTNRRVRTILMERERKTLRERMPNARPEVIDRIAERRLPGRLNGISARLRIAERRMDADRLRKIIDDLNSLIAE